MRLRILAAALSDLEGGREFYSRHGAEIGDYFINSLFSDIDSLVLYAGIHIELWGFHRLLAKRFPYAIYYKVDGDLCTVWRILDCRQNPRGTQRSLE
jgi:plasmid stabilization system protein ParE